MTTSTNIPARPTEPASPGTWVIRTDQLTKRYGRTLALDGLDLEVTAGEIHGFLGPNGAGKTTTIRILLGMLRPTSGSATLLGQDPWADSVALHARLAYVPGDVTLWPNLTGGEVIDLLGRLHTTAGKKAGPGRRAELLDRFELDPTKQCRTYSKGNRQKVALVAAFCAEAELLILDEPTSGLDPLMEEEFRRAVREERDRGRTVLLSSHILSEAESLCDRVSIIRAGRLVETTPLSELRAARQSVITAELLAAPKLEGVAGVHDVELTDNSPGSAGTRLTCRVEPDAIDELLIRLTQAGVRSLISAPPSLEDIFLSHYQSHPSTDDPTTDDQASDGIAVGAR